MSTLGQPTHFYYVNDVPTVTLRFDKARHVYLREVAGKLIPQTGVTSAIHIIDKSDFLVPWAAKMAAQKVLKDVPVELDLQSQRLIVPQMDYDAFEEIVMAAKSAPKDQKEEAGNVGTIAHECLELSIKAAIRSKESPGEVIKLVKPPLNDRAFHCASAALDWMTKHKVRWVLTERKVYSKQYEFAGTMDGLGYVSSCGDPKCCPEPFTDRLSILDWKSSNYLYATYAFQTAAYEHAYEEEFGVDITDRFVLRLGKTDGKFEMWHLTADSFRADFDAFLLAMQLYKANNAAETRFAAMKKARTARKRAK